MTKDKLLIICGPTATGKTDLALHLAKQFDGELINADSRQVYRGMDIVTGKDLSKNSEFRIRNSELGIRNEILSVGFREKEGIPIWLIDIVNPDYVFNVGEYQRLAQTVIQDIHKRNKLPVVVGGTGLYIKSIINPIPLAQIPPNDLLRLELASLTLSQLQKRLQQIDQGRWEVMNDSDRANSRRLIRALEISEFLSCTKTSVKIPASEKKFDTLIIGLTASREILFQRIDSRVEKRINDGAVGELKNLIKKGYSANLPSLSATGYRELSLFVDSVYNLDEAVNRWKISEHAYAKRQMTWFRKDKRITWFDITNSDYRDKIVQQVEKWYTAF